MFEHVNHLGDLELKSRQVDGVRFYGIPSGDLSLNYLCNIT